MKIDLNEKQKKLLLEILGMHHAILHFKGEDNSSIEVLVGKIADSLKQSGEMHIFDSVFNEEKK